MNNENYLKKELYELIRTDERIFDFIQESSLDGLWYWDIEKPENEWMNPKFWTVLGYNPEEMPHKSSAWQNIINQDDLKVAIDNFTKHCENPNHPYDQVVRYTHKNGSTIWIRCRGLAIRDKYGKAVRMLGAHQDISDIKNREQELIKANEMVHASEKKLKSILDNMLDLVAITDLRGNYKFAGKSHKILGYEIEYLIGKNVMGFVHPDDITGVQAKFADFITNQKPSANAIYRNRCANGSYLWFETIATLILDNDGNSKEIIFNTRNITERKETELLLQEKNEEIAAQNEEMAAQNEEMAAQNEEIAAQNEEMTVQNEELNQANQKLIAARERAEESEEKTRYILKHNPNAIAVFDNQMNMLIVSDRFLKDYDVKDKNIIGRNLYEVFPEIPEKWRKTHKKALQGEVLSNDDDYFIRPDGNITYSRWECRPWYRSDNSIGGMIAYTEVITERKLAEIALKESERNLQLKNEEYSAINEELLQTNDELIKAKEKAEESEQLQRTQKEEVKLNNERLESLLRITQYKTKSNQELLDFALAEAIKLTNSKIGYIYFYQEDTRRFILNTWSDEVMDECRVMNPQTVYDLDKTGCWGDAVRQRKPIVINNYQEANPIKKGTPNGHVQLLKFLTIPVMIEGKIVAVAGVANKDTDYDDADIRQLTLLMDNVWKISERVELVNNLEKAKQKAEESEGKLIEAQKLSHVGSWEYYSENDTVYWSKELYNIFELPHDLPAPNYSEQSQFYTKESFAKLDKAVQDCIRDEIPYEIELDIITSSGAIKQIISKGNVINDKNNKLIGCYGTAQDITEQKALENAITKAKEKAEESEGKFRSYIENAPDGIFIADENGKYIEVNKSACRITGYSEDELLELTVSDLIQDEYLDTAINHFRTVVKDGFANSDLGYITKSGEKKFWNVNAVKLTDTRFLGFAKDITEHKQAEEKLKLLNRAVEASSVSVEITDAEGNINYVNPFFTELTGFSYEEAWGKNPRFLKSGNHPKEFYKDLWGTILSGKDWAGEFQNKKKNGELYWEKAVISPILNSNGEVANFVAIKDDITERKKILEELVAAKEKAEESDRLKSAFLANMSHEIRTPMNGIFGFAQLLKEPDLTGDEQQEYIKIIEKSGKRMLNIINDIVDISKIEAGLMELDMIETNINEQIKYIYTFFKPEAENKGIKLSYKIALPEEEASVTTDREKVIAILTNLVKNAIKYTEIGSIEFGYNVIESKHTKYLKFYVKDTGIGINKDRQEAIFERFIQAEIIDKKARQGAGLGLSISKAYLEMLGGKFLLESEEGKGSTFYFTLPYQLEPSKETNEWQPEPSEKSDDVRKLKILIAEDDEVSEMLLDKAVKIFGKVILKAKTGVEAVELCRDNPDTDLIMMDIQMPEMNGYEATQLIREFNKEVIIIAQTAYGLSGDREKAIETGCNDYIAKPINKIKLHALIKNYFG